MTDKPAEEAARECTLACPIEHVRAGLRLADTPLGKREGCACTDCIAALLTTREAELRARIDALIEPGKGTAYVKWAFDLAESLGYSSVSASGPGPFIEAKLAELKAEIERLNREWPEDASLEKRRAEKAEAALAEMGSRLWQTANDLAEAQKRVERLTSAFQVAVGVLQIDIDCLAEKCINEKPHDHALLRRLREIVVLLDAALAPENEEGKA